MHINTVDLEILCDKIFVFLISSCKNIFVVGTTHENFLQYVNVIVYCKTNLVFFIFVVCTNHKNIFTTKISRSTVVLIVALQKLLPIPHPVVMELAKYN